MTLRAGHQVFDASVAEMRSDLTSDTKELVVVDPALLQAVAEGDDNPLFVTLNIATEGVSKNGRLYTRETIQSIADQINAEAVDGYNGHLSDAERATKRPDTVTLWLGANVVVKNGKAHLYAKGYVMPEETRLRSYLKKAKALRKNVAVSIFGKAEKAVFDAETKAYKLVNFVLQSIDWARSKSEGIVNDGTLILASEMVNEEENTMTRKEVLESLTKEELRTERADLVAEMEQEAVEAAGVPVSEMEQITELVGEKPAEVVAEMLRENRELKLDQELASKVKIRNARPVLREMVVAEMEKAENKASINVSEMVDSVLAGDEGRAIIAQHVSKTPVINPLDSSRGESVPSRKFSKLVKRNKK